MHDPARCDCCTGVKTLTPVEPVNPPGQTALVRRVGTHGSFLQSQLTALSGQLALAGYTTRDRGDPALALVDAWSAVLDVLAFYQERVANENYLRTATERRSVLELARTIGYELRPGVAASTWLAFTLETAPGAPAQARLDADLATQSVPAQDEQPQVFETLAPLEARSAWNALEVVHDEAPPPYWGQRTLWLAGQNTRLQPGDALLVVGDERRGDPGNENWDFRRVQRVLVVPPEVPSADPLAGATVVTLDRGLGSADPFTRPARIKARVYALRTRASLFGQAAPDWRAMPPTLRAATLGFDDAQAASIASFPQWPGYTLADTSDPPTGSATGTGLYAEYYEGTNFRRRVWQRTDPALNFEPGAASPVPGVVPADNFSARWTGWVQFPADGDYTFTVRADDGVRLWLAGRLRVDRWVDQGATEYTATLVGRRAGEKVDLRIDYYEHGGASVLQLFWQGPGIAGRPLVPTERLYPRDIHTVHLDASYPKVVKGGWAVLAIPEYEELYEVQDQCEAGLSAFTLSTKSTRLTLRGERLRELFNERLRDTAVYAESVELPTTVRPLSGLAGGQQLLLATAQPELPAERWLAVSGHLLPADSAANRHATTRLDNGDGLAAVAVARDGASATLTFTDGEVSLVALKPASEVVQLRRATVANGRTVLELATPLAGCYLPQTLRINANVVPASHGDSQQRRIQPEVLGSGNGSAALQRFVLLGKPLTHVSAATPSGTASTLEVRVDGVTWPQVARLSDLGPTDRGYIARSADDGTVSVQFGDGTHGRRLPSGPMNVRARYRVGIGSAGNLAACQISQLRARPLGVKDVVNPVPAAGGADPEPRDSARRNAPLAVRTLDRIVSLRDFEDFASAYAGIGKAQAVWLWDGQGRMVHLTVAGVDGRNIAPGSALATNLRAAIDAVRPAHQVLTIAAATVLRFGLTAGVRVLPDFKTRSVLAALRAALAAAFGFEQRSYGQALAGSQVLAVMQAVSGVAWVDLDTLRQRDAAGLLVATDHGADARLHARAAHWLGNSVKPAELLLLDAADIVLTELTANPAP